MSRQTPSAPVTTGGFTVRYNQSKGRWDVREDGKFRRDFETKEAADQFVDGEKKGKKGKTARK